MRSFADQAESLAGSQAIGRNNTNIIIDFGSTLCLSGKALQLCFDTKIGGCYLEPVKLQTLTSPDGELERHYHVAVQNDEEFIWIMDMNSRVTHVSASAAYLLGYGPRAKGADRQSSGAVANVAAEVQEKVIAEVQRIADNVPKALSGPWMLHMGLNRKDGSVLLTETSVSHLYGRDGGPCAMVCLTRDYTKQQSEQELFRTLADSSPIGVYIVQDGRFQFVNMQFEQFAKFSQHELIGASAMSFVLPPDRDRVRQMAIAMLKDERFEPYEFRFISKDGETRWVMETVASIHYKGGRATLGTFMDVTQLKKAERELRRSEGQLRLMTQRMLEIQETERARFARDLHDQLGQELVYLKMQAESLARSLADAPHLQEQAKELALVAGRLKTASNRIAANIGPGMLNGLGLGKAIEWCAEEFERRTGISCPVDTPIRDIEVPRPTSIAAYRILQEALTNVSRHAGASQVEVKLEKEGEAVLLHIADNGVGINARLLSLGPTFGLLGMYERARLAGGILTVSSASGRGTQISARFPIGKVHPFS
jgi:PAS domain S-box-containing protein